MASRILPLDIRTAAKTKIYDEICHPSRDLHTTHQDENKLAHKNKHTRNNVPLLPAGITKILYILIYVWKLTRVFVVFGVVLFVQSHYGNKTGFEFAQSLNMFVYFRSSFSSASPPLSLPPVVYTHALRSAKNPLAECIIRVDDYVRIQFMMHKHQCRIYRYFPHRKYLCLNLCYVSTESVCMCTYYSK